MSIRTSFLLIFLGLINSGCEKATKEEISAIHELNEKFSDFEFAPVPGLVGTHLKVNVLKISWDSLELKGVYDSSVGRFKDRNGIPWVYLSVHDQSGKYLFTIVKDEAKGSHVFFKE